MINKFSLNVIGGYTAGINGFEMAGAFNIDKKDVQYVQIAGGFNVVGGKTVGAQLAGVYNLDLDSVTGAQAGGIANRVKGSVTGVQLAGIFNHVEKTVKGMQAAGIYNHALDSVQGVQLSGIYNYVKNDLEGVQASGLANRVKGRTSGLQVAGLANSSKGEMDGVQVSGFLNYASRLKGVQIGLVNIADTADGYMLGLINIVKKGYHKLALSSNETLPINLSYKTGVRYLYSILVAGYSPGVNEKAYSLGLGIGSDLPLSKRLAWVTELTYSSFYLGNWDAMPNFYRLQTSLQVQLGKKVSLFAGPAFSIYDANHVHPATGYKTSMPATSSFGWTAGINFF
ncbi:MAG TPA: hypothetical protein VL832_18100 [Puia sp.]|nr:hypothetical protein [Puia sp.]